MKNAIALSTKVHTLQRNQTALLKELDKSLAIKELLTSLNITPLWPVRIRVSKRYQAPAKFEFSDERGALFSILQPHVSVVLFPKQLIKDMAKENRR